MPAGITRAQFQPFSPLSIPSCVLWLRADLGITLATGVSAWKDQSKAAVSFVQATGTKQPAFIANDPSYNNMPTLQFVSANAQTLSATIAATSQPFTAFVVGETSGAAQQEFYGGNAQNTTGPYWTGVQYAAYAGTNLGALGPLSLIQTKQAFCAIMNNTTSAIYINNSQTANSTGSVGSDVLDTAFNIGDGSGVGSFLNGKLAELIIYNGTATAAQRGAVFSYFGARYNIATS